MSDKSDIRRVSLASAIGSTLEWYDFFIFGASAALVFNVLFFPSSDPLAGTIASLASFAVGFIARPLGGVLFGHFGDRIGRKAMLVLSLIMMGGVTFVIGLLPTYESIGIWAPILLTGLRLLQGLAVGGEWGGATLMVVEHAPAKHRGFYGSWPQMGIPAALILSTGVMAAVNAFTTKEEFLAWGWRIPFLLSAILVIVGYFIRKRVSESPSFNRLKSTKAQARLPIATIFKTQKKRVLLMVGSQAAENTSFYIAAVFSLVYLTQTLQIDRSVALRALMIAAAFTLIAQPLFGALSDRIGRKKVFMGGMIFLGLFAFPFFEMLNTRNEFIITVAMVLSLMIGQGSTQAIQPSLFGEQFPAAIRYSGVSVAYQLATVVWSGPTPVLAAMFVVWTGSYWPIAAYVLIAGLISTLCILPLREAAAVELEQIEHEESDVAVAAQPAVSRAMGGQTA
ncbi:MFS transporter [Bordetella sp. 02P26C-1]|uniref:MFS transporter n=1 Tax=Bordetella sp. 02P26C-1 TaxID=2683195 RepID=UPI0013558D11|nr:MFS transporter [Bordetella sp. 02P26C-1]MVW79469.1 MFS transporter [Bordetella sp. 02P26C-1]